MELQPIIKQEKCMTSEEFLAEFRPQAEQCLQNAYEAEAECYQLLDGTLATSLPEDIVSLLETQQRLLTDQLGSSSPAWKREWWKLVTECLEEQQQRHVSLRLISLEDACAAAYDFLRLAERLETWEEDQDHQTLSRLYSRDAAEAVDHTTRFYLRQLSHETTLTDDLFSSSWLEDGDNTCAKEIVDLADIHLQKLCNNWKSAPFLYHKAQVLIARAVSRMYLHKLLEKCERGFHNPTRALLRMKGDVAVFKAFWEKVWNERKRRPVCAILELIHECMSVLASSPLRVNDHSPEDDDVTMMMIVLHQRTGANVWVTQHIWRDLHRLVRRPLPSSHTWQGVIKPELERVTSNIVVVRREKPVAACVNEESDNTLLRTLYEDRLGRSLCAPVALLGRPIQDCAESVGGGVVETTLLVLDAIL